MAITQEQIQKIDKWMRQKNVRAACECCGNTGWQASDIIASPTFSGGNFNIGGPTTPMLPIVCTHCGNVRLFAAVLLGIVPQEAEQQA